MFGDLFGGPAFRTIIQRAPIFVPGTPGTPGVNQTLGGTFVIQSTNTPVFFTTFPIFSPAPPGTVAFTLSGPATLPGVSGVFQPPLTHFNQGTITPGSFGVAPGTVAPLVEQQMVRSQVLASAVSQFGPGGTLTLTQSAATAQPFQGSSEDENWTVATLYNYAIPGTPGTPGQVIPRAPIIVTLPSPTGGGVVGLTKIADDNSPLPRDRVFFDYDYFDSVPLTAQNIGVHRFSPGFEKTFLDGQASIEVRVPFASTASTDILGDGINNGGHVEFGDVNITLKALVYQSQILNVAAGVGIALPTASDVKVNLLDGTKLFQINNDALVLTPYIAYLVTPNDRWFFQNWIECGFDANGNRVLADADLSGNLLPVGRLTDQPLLQIDAQLGYWLYRSADQSALVRGLAPFIEAHYNTTLGKASFLQAGAFSLGDPSGTFNEVNLSAGFTLQLRDNLNISLGAVVPVTGQDDRSFNWQLGLRGSWFFGATPNNRAGNVSNF